ncbi:hypothetical protein LWM68_04095 [Niabella sp. W65]|nr:hypothetical protein [Niabella sp. W65]MCH7362025.1 hypothetical protein [Niabella sp. W65]
MGPEGTRVWQISERAEALKYGVAPGDFKVQDLNGDGKYSNADRQFLGYTTPRFQWTLRNEFTIRKRFDFSFMLYSNWGIFAVIIRLKTIVVFRTGRTLIYSHIGLQKTLLTIMQGCIPATAAQPILFTVKHHL